MYELLEHKADIGILASGDTWEKAFADGALAMLSVMAEPETIEIEKEVQIEVTAPDKAALFVEFLNEILFIRDSEEMFLKKFEIKIGDGSLAGKAWGEKINPKKHSVKIEVKAATYSGLKAWEENGLKKVRCVLDV